MISDLTISNHNRKLKNVNIFNLPTGLTCKDGVLCSKYCYAKKAERMYKAVREARMRNYATSKKSKFPDLVIDRLKNSKYNVTRLHESGDFYSEIYIDKWYYIINKLSSHTFFAYTKRDDIFNADILAVKPKNLVLIKSIDGILPDDYNIKQLSIDARMEGYDKISVVRESTHTCPSTAKNKFKVQCIKHCKLCINKYNTVVEFSKH